VRAGSVVVGGVDLMALGPRALRAARRQIGVIYQSYGLVPQLSAGVNVALGELAGGSDRSALRALARGPALALSQRVLAALERVGLADRVADRVADLSGGQQQRVAVARLLVQRPALILADEPVSAVDPVTGERVLEALGELSADGATLLIALHDVALARSYPRVVAVRQGTVAFDGPPSELDADLLPALYAERRPTPTPVADGRHGTAAEPFALPLDSDGYGLRAR
jgi:phosphonate transport system ATP-binding protein